ncbi:LacI family transcriptional regulator, partial [Veillonellaceae bacterium M2-8]|nr:LacI family transcriptional regulator [Veillonellaceae bacterium M2-8]
MSTRRPTGKKVSLADVARLAGVSSNTVSRVVRGDPEVADATRARISLILTEVGYRPN